MLRKNDVLELVCTDLGANMEGICRSDNLVIFVPGMLPGEKGMVHITKVQSSCAFGFLESLLSGSPERKNHDCESFPQCGGCSARHMTYGTTLLAKQSQVSHCFHSIGHIDIEIPPVIGMEKPYHYRNKSSFPVGKDQHSEPVLGFFAPRSHRIVPVHDCINAMEPTSAVCHAFLSWMKENHISSYNEENHTGLIRHIIVRVNQKHESMVTLVSRKKNVPKLDDLSTRLKQLNVSSFVLNVNAFPTNVILGDDFFTVFGSGTLHDQILGLDFELSSASFFQVNVPQAEKIYSLAVDFADLTSESVVYDVYCGTGTISLLLAAHCKQVIGIEIVPQAIQNAVRNAQQNQIENVSFHTGKAEDLLPELIHTYAKPDVIVVDPPRKGLDPSVIQTVCQTGPSRIVYVSCNPATLARDVSRIAEYGYTVDKIQCVDMFCWTSDVETVVCLSNKNARP